jgi:hypothetical protein
MVELARNQTVNADLTAQTRIFHALLARFVFVVKAVGGPRRPNAARALCKESLSVDQA